MDSIGYRDQIHLNPNFLGSSETANQNVHVNPLFMPQSSASNTAQPSSSRQAASSSSASEGRYNTTNSSNTTYFDHAHKVTSKVINNRTSHKLNNNLKPYTLESTQLYQASKSTLTEDTYSDYVNEVSIDSVTRSSTPQITNQNLYQTSAFNSDRCTKHYVNSCAVNVRHDSNIEKLDEKNKSRFSKHVIHKENASKSFFINPKFISNNINESGSVSATHSQYCVSKTSLNLSKNISNQNSMASKTFTKADVEADKQFMKSEIADLNSTNAHHCSADKSSHLDRLELRNHTYVEPHFKCSVSGLEAGHTVVNDQIKESSNVFVNPDFFKSTNIKVTLKEHILIENSLKNPNVKPKSHAQPEKSTHVSAKKSIACNLQPVKKLAMKPLQNTAVLKNRDKYHYVSSVIRKSPMYSYSLIPSLINNDSSIIKYVYKRNTTSHSCVQFTTQSRKHFIQSRNLLETKKKLLARKSAMAPSIGTLEHSGVHFIKSPPIFLNKTKLIRHSNKHTFNAKIVPACKSNSPDSSKKTKPMCSPRLAIKSANPSNYVQRPAVLLTKNKIIRKRTSSTSISARKRLSPTISNNIINKYRTLSKHFPSGFSSRIAQYSIVSNNKLVCYKQSNYPRRRAPQQFEWHSRTAKHSASSTPAREGFRALHHRYANRNLLTVVCRGSGRHAKCGASDHFIKIGSSMYKSTATTLNKQVAKEKMLNFVCKATPAVRRWHQGTSWSRCWGGAPSTGTVFPSLSSLKLNNCRRSVVTKCSKQMVLVAHANKALLLQRLITAAKQRSVHVLQRRAARVRPPAPQCTTAARPPYCRYYHRFGRCNRGTACPYEHNPARVAICTRFLRGRCRVANCLFAHTVDKGRMPVCSHFLQGALCTREQCPYLHVNPNRNAPICDDFLHGHCDKREQCKLQHVLECAEFRETGRCPRKAGCPLPHPKQRRQQHAAAGKRNKGSKRTRSDDNRHVLGADVVPKKSAPSKKRPHSRYFSSEKAVPEDQLQDKSKAITDTLKYIDSKMILTQVDESNELLLAKKRRIMSLVQKMKTRLGHTEGSLCSSRSNARKVGSQVLDKGNLKITDDADVIPVIPLVMFQNDRSLPDFIPLCMPVADALSSGTIAASSSSSSIILSGGKLYPASIPSNSEHHSPDSVELHKLENEETTVQFTPLPS